MSDSAQGLEPAAIATPINFATQSTPKHVAIIMDGNRRWARARGVPDAVGHHRGAAALEALLPAVARTSIETLTLFGFASANWRRESSEVRNLMQIAERSMKRLQPACARELIRVEMIGRRDRLPRSLVRAISGIEEATANGTRRLRIALDYSSREAIVAAARAAGPLSDANAFSRRLGTGGDVDLLIRTGREQRLSDFLLWECAFAELYFPDVHWPEFNGERLFEALEWYQRRNRRFGR